MRVPGITTTFWPRLQRSPITAPGRTWQKCQIFVPADLRAVVDITRFMDEELRHLGPDHLDLELQLDAGLFGDRLPHVLEELEHVTRRGGAGVHDVVRVQRRDLSAADGEALQSAFVD